LGGRGMRITPLIMGAALIFVLIVGATVGLFNAGKANQLYEEQAYTQLISIAESKAERVEYFIDNRKADAVFLAGSEGIHSIFDEELDYDIELITGKIKNIAEKTKYEVEEYIREHPEMTVKGLQESEEFQSIAVEKQDIL
jgi:hypothetical protein